MKRESFNSRLGFILVSAGCAIGIGNVWRFPYVVGQNGGGLFVLIYLFFLICLGVPALTMEFAVGRAGKSSVLPAFQELEKPGQVWHIHGFLCIIGCYLLMMYYTTVSGWMVSYFFKFLSGTFADGMDNAAVGNVFSGLLANPKEMAFWMAVTVIGGFTVNSFGLQNGLERITKVMMSALLVLIMVLAAHSFVLSGAGEGLNFYLMPNLERAKAVGLGKVITAAMNQAFFTLSLGIGSMEIFGSYMSRENTLATESLQIALLDTFVAIMSGLIIFPACFSYGVHPDAGPALIFVTLPNVFVNMSGGRIWGTLFFMFMSFASFSTVIAVFENLIANCMDILRWSRKKSSIINCFIVLFGSLPCVLGYNVWSDLQLIGARDVLDSEDFIVSNLLLPVGALVFLMFCVSRWGWGYENYLEECNTGKGIRMPKGLKPYLLFVMPVCILVILVQGLL